MSMDDLMNFIYGELSDDADNCRANRIIDAVDEYMDSVRPLPCVRNEHGEIAQQTYRQLLQKINEELDELKAAVVCYDHMDDDEELLNVAEEAADTITAITTLCEALGIDAEARNEAQRQVNDRNRERGRL